MTTNTDKPVGPGIFSRDGHSITIAEDGKVLVKKDDWLSKYSWALYGDYETWDVFVRGNPDIRSANEQINGIKEIDDPDLIKTGEYLIHVPTYFSWAERRGKKVEPRKKPLRPKKPKGGGLIRDRLVTFLRTLKQLALTVNDWEFKGSGGLDLSAFVFAGGYTVIEAQHRNEPEPYYYRGVSAGLGAGPEDLLGSAAVAPLDMPFGTGYIGKLSMAGLALSADEICGNYILVDFSAGFILGGSLSLLLFGINAPPQAALRSLVRYLRGEDDFGIWPSAPYGFIAMAGTNWSSPNFGVSFKIGVMHRWECVTGRSR